MYMDWISRVRSALGRRPMLKCIRILNEGIEKKHFQRDRRHHSEWLECLRRGLDILLLFILVVLRLRIAVALVLGVAYIL